VRAHIRAFAQIIACDTHPIQNLKILKRVITLTGDKDQGPAWARTTIEEGLAACEAMLPDSDLPYCFGEAPGLADIVLVPQLANARRFGVDMGGYPRLVRIDERCRDLPAFIKAAPENQRDFEA
jgi:maleylpyruvate isomerase